MRLRDPFNRNKSKFKSMETDSVVLSHGGFITFPKAKVLSEVPVGVYYPTINSNDDSFILTQISPDLIGGSDRFDDLLMDDLDFGARMRPERIEAAARENVDREENDAYFPMEHYHEGIGMADANIRSFLDSKEFYKEQKLGYKRSVLFYGEPGTGKSRYIDQLGTTLISNYDAVVMRIGGPHELSAILKAGIPVLNKVLKGRLKVFIIEELVTLLERDFKTELLNLLDHPYLRDDVMFLMTTNNPEQLPSNIVDRPSRVDLLVEVNSKGLNKEFIAAWYKFLMGQNMPEDAMNEMSQLDDLSPAYLKELFVSSRVTGQSLQDSMIELRDRKSRVKSQFKQAKDIGFG
ncbi:MAG: AAA family ATPase [Balneolia bacterium]|nr:AAA family ATPase [Balneolia bacterium]